MDTSISTLFKSKLRSNDIMYKYTLTTDEKDDGWIDAVEEVCHRGISIKSFGDTSDKYVFHPGHLGYDFYYFWGKGQWSNKTCWSNKVPDEICTEALEKLYIIGQELSKSFKVKIHT